MTKNARNGYLITGGTGFLGRALVRRLLTEGGVYPEHHPERVCIYSRGEAAQALMRSELKDDPRLRWFIGDVRDRDRLAQAMESVRIVVHAAALKRIEVGIYNPTEMVKTNVLGTQNVIEAAIATDVARAVLVSTDKAVEPLNCYGATKLVAEKLFLNAQALAGAHGPRFSAVRYGNVAGSTGSVVPTWRAAIKAGEKLRITHPDATRFWLSARQAVDLVLQALEAETGSLVVPELPAYRLGDLLLTMTLKDDEALGADVEILGALGPDEKLHESLLSRHEPGGPRDSDRAPRLSIDGLRKLLEEVEGT